MTAEIDAAFRRALKDVGLGDKIVTAILYALDKQDLVVTDLGRPCVWCGQPIRISIFKDQKYCCELHRKYLDGELVPPQEELNKEDTLF